MVTENGTKYRVGLEANLTNMLDFRLEAPFLEYLFFAESSREGLQLYLPLSCEIVMPPMLTPRSMP
jgi:hypothetical protein